MADFATWAAAAEPGLRFDDGAVMRAYAAQREQAIEIAIEGSPVASAVLRLLDEREKRPDWPGRWEGTASALLGDLNKIVW